MDHPCRRCGEALTPGSRWCNLCHRRVLDIDPHELGVELRATVRSGWTRPARFSTPHPTPRFSRTQAGPLSFGRGVKATLSAAVLAGVLAFRSVVSFADLYRDVFMVPMAVLAVWLLRQIWRRERIE